MSRLKTLLLLLSVPMALAAQGAYKGQLHVSDEQFSIQGDMLRVHMKVSYDDKVLNTGETLTFTPVLKTGHQFVRLSSVAINGDSRERYERRVDKLKKRRRINVPVVTRDNQRHTRFFIYDTTVPYQQWMASASMYAECEESTWQGRSPHTYEDLLMQRIPLGQPAGALPLYGENMAATATSAPALTFTGVRIAKEWVQFLSPEVVSTGGIVIRGTLRVPYDCRLTSAHYRTLVDSLQQAVSRETSSYGSRLLGIELTGYGAPIGNRPKNEQRAAEQVLKLRQELSRRNMSAENELRVQWISEDWDSIRQLVSASKLPLQAAASDIIASIPVDQGREQALRTLGSGATYDVMRHELFPRVCRLNYQLSFSPRPVVINVNSYRNGTIPAAITPDNFYQTATAFEIGSQEFCDIIDLAARLFPNCAEAAIDAAGVALLKGDAQRARRYLQPWDTDPRAWCNLGLLNLLEGNRDKAEVYLRMAEADGVGSAREALKSLQWK